MTISKHIDYDKHNDSIIGFVENSKVQKNTDAVDGEKRKNPPVADQGVVFVVRGLSAPWKQIIGYELINHNMDKDTLNKAIQTTVKTLFDIGFHPDALFMDQ